MVLVNSIKENTKISIHNIEDFKILTAVDVQVLERMYTRVDGFRDKNVEFIIDLLESAWFSFGEGESFSNISNITFNEKVLILRKFIKLGLAKSRSISSNDIPSTGSLWDEKNQAPNNKLYFVSGDIMDNFSMTLYGSLFVETFKFKPN